MLIFRTEILSRDNPAQILKAQFIKAKKKINKGRLVLNSILHTVL